MTVIVTDASAIVELLRRAGSGDHIAEHLRSSTAVAPAHIDTEVLSALGQLERGGFTSDHAVESAISHPVRLPVERVPIRPLLHRAWQLRQNVALRDGLYGQLRVPGARAPSSLPSCAGRRPSSRSSRLFWTVSGLWWPHGGCLPPRRNRPHEVLERRHGHRPHHIRVESGSAANGLGRFSRWDARCCSTIRQNHR